MIRAIVGVGLPVLAVWAGLIALGLRERRESLLLGLARAFCLAMGLTSISTFATLMVGASVPLVTRPSLWPWASNTPAPSRTGTRSRPTRPTRLHGGLPASYFSMAVAPGYPPARAPPGQIGRAHV